MTVRFAAAAWNAFALAGWVVELKTRTTAVEARAIAGHQNRIPMVPLGLEEHDTPGHRGSEEYLEKGPRCVGASVCRDHKRSARAAGRLVARRGPGISRRAVLVERAQRVDLVHVRVEHADRRL